MSNHEVHEMVELLEVGAAERGTPYTGFAVVDDLRQGKTKDNKPYAQLRLSDVGASHDAKVWSDVDGGKALVATGNLTKGEVVKVLFEVDLWQGAPQLRVLKLRPATAEEVAARRDHLFGPFFDLVQEIGCRMLAFDIETVPAVERRALPSPIAEKLAKHAEYQKLEPDSVMGMSPLFGKVVSLAFADADPKSEGLLHALVVPPKNLQDPLPEWMRPMSEADLLRLFWALARQAEVVISFNGRGFDIPFLIGRSLVHRIPVRVDLLGNRYSLRPHLDLYRVLAGSERSLGPGGLDVVCWALGIESPKNDMDGAMVAPAYERGEIERIATYNAADVRATVQLFQRLEQDLLRYRQDW